MWYSNALREEKLLNFPVLPALFWEYWVENYADCRDHMFRLCYGKGGIRCRMYWSSLSAVLRYQAK